MAVRGGLENAATQFRHIEALQCFFEVSSSWKTIEVELLVLFKGQLKSKRALIPRPNAFPGLDIAAHEIEDMPPDPDPLNDILAEYCVVLRGREKRA